MFHTAPLHRLQRCLHARGGHKRQVRCAYNNDDVSRYPATSVPSPGHRRSQQISLSLLFMEPFRLLQIGKKCKYQKSKSLSTPTRVRTTRHALPQHAVRPPRVFLFDPYRNGGTCTKTQRDMATTARTFTRFSLQLRSVCVPTSQWKQGVCVSFSFVAPVAQSQSTCQTRAHELHLPTC